MVNSIRPLLTAAALGIAPAALLRPCCTVEAINDLGYRAQVEASR